MNITEITKLAGPNKRRKRVGRGIGSRLLGELVEKAREYGFNQMVAIITANAANSIALHKKHGFEILGRFPELGYKFERWHNTVHMQRKL